MSQTPAKTQALGEMLEGADLERPEHERNDKKEFKSILNQKHLLNFERALIPDKPVDNGD